MTRPTLFLVSNSSEIFDFGLDPVGFAQQTHDIIEVLNKYQSEKETGEDNVDLVVLNWPEERCPLLAEDVVLMDSPGVDMTRSHDTWIQKYCQDADIFILVANSESTIMLREKAFFKSVAETVSMIDHRGRPGRHTGAGGKPGSFSAARGAGDVQGEDGRRASGAAPRRGGWSRGGPARRQRRAARAPRASG